MATFAEIMASQPEVMGTDTVSNLLAGGQTLATGYSTFQSIANLTSSWTGSSAQVQGGQASSLFNSGQQVLTAINQTQAIVKAGSAQLQAAKKQLLAIVQAAKAAHLIVYPTGVVTPNPSQLSGPHASAFIALAAKFNAQIQAVVLQTTLADVQVALSLVKTASDILGAFMKKDDKNATTPTTTVPATTTGLTGSSGTTVGTGSTLAGAGAFGGYNPGVAGLTGAGMSGASAGIGLGTGSVTGFGPGLAGAAGRGVPGAGGSAGRAAAGNTAMVGGGAGAGAGGARDEQRDAQGWLLAEDGDAFAPGELPDTSEGVLS